MKNKKAFTLSFHLEWMEATFHVIEIAIHDCPHCNIFLFTVFGISVAIGFVDQDGLPEEKPNTRAN